MDLAVRSARPRSLHEAGVIEGPFHRHAIDTEQSRDSLEAQTRMGLSSGQALWQLGDMGRGLEQIERNGQIVAQLAFALVPSRFQDGSGPENEPGAGPYLTRIKGL
jgi:hypothetical protein